MDKEHIAIMRLREASVMSLQIYQKPLVVTTSGGKDSSACVALAERAGIPFEVMHDHLYDLMEDDLMIGGNDGTTD